MRGAAAVVVLVALGCRAEEPPRAGIEIDSLPGDVVVVHSPAEGSWEEDDVWRLVEEVRIGSATTAGPEAFTRVVGLEIDDYGRAWVLDGPAKELRVFDSTGAHFRTVGRAGGGPGELEGPNGTVVDPEGRVWVQDPANSRYTVFDTTGALVDTRRRAFPGYTVRWRGAFDSEGRLIDPSFVMEGGFRHVILRHDPGLQAADTFPLPARTDQTFTFRSGRVSGVFTIPFAPRETRVLDPDGALWLGYPDAYRIVRVTLEGDTTRVVERDYDPVPVTDAEKEAALQETMGGFDFPLSESDVDLDRSRIPDVRPAYETFLAEPDGTLWVDPGGEGPAFLDVFGPDGVYLGRVATPVETVPDGPWRFRGDRLWVVTRDSLDVPYVVRLRIER